MKTAIALYDDFTTAQRVVQDLVDEGFERDNISIVSRESDGEYATTAQSTAYADSEDVSAGEGAGIGALEGGVLGLLAGLGALAIPGIGPVLAAGPLVGALIGATAGAVTGGLVAGLMDSGVPESDAQYYAEGVRRGSTLVSVSTRDEQIGEAVAIMNRYNPVNIDQRADSWQQSGYSGFDATAEPLTREDITRERSSYSTTTDTTNTLDTDIATDRERTNISGETVVPVIEEELHVGKRTVESGGVRVHSHVEQKPVQEQVQLRHEEVHVERRPANRPVSNADMANLQDRTIEMTETSEVPVVAKEARVVEEVVVGKTVEQRTETISDTVRRVDVDIERIDENDFNSYDTSFRNHYQTTYGSAGHDYNRYQPGYRYGYALGRNESYRNRDWTSIEPEIRRDWESRNQGPWEDFKDSVQHGWNEVRRNVNV